MMEIKLEMTDNLSFFRSPTVQPVFMPEPCRMFQKNISQLKNQLKPMFVFPIHRNLVILRKCTM